MKRGLVVSGGAAFALVGTGSLRASAQQAPFALRVATTPIDAGAQPFFAQALGFFKAAGLDVEISKLSNGSAIAAAVASGAVDIGQSNVVSVATARERGIPFALIAGGNLVVSRVRQAALIVQNASPIRAAHDLEGKTVAVNGIGTIPHVGARAWIDQNGGDSAKVHYLEVPFSAMAAALEAGRIDCAFVSEPQLDAAMRGAQFRILGYPYDAIARTFLLGAWFTTTTWARAHPEIVQKFATVMQKTSKWANANQAASGKILADETGIAVSSTRVLFGDLEPALIQPVLDISAKYGVLKTAMPAADILADAAR